jgi:hypothetical protein
LNYKNHQHFRQTTHPALSWPRIKNPSIFTAFKLILTLFFSNIILRSSSLSPASPISLLSLDLTLFSNALSYIANPDLVERITNDWPLASAAYNLFYRVEGDDQSVGLTDFPVYSPPAAADAAGGAAASQ